MKTPTEKAIDYCLEVEGQIHQSYIDAFLAGYKAAQEWISVEDELPETEMWINVKSELSGMSPFYKSMFYVLENKTALKLNYTHWKPIE